MTPDTFAALINLGAAGAVIIVVVLFLKSNKERDDAWNMAQKERDAQWRDFFTALNSNNKADVCELAETMARMVKALDDHDKQAKVILEGVQKIDKELTRPLRAKRNTE